MTILLTILISYIISSFFGYVIHWSLHQSWAGFFNKAHMTHHQVLYPPSDFTSEKYRHAGKDSAPKFFALATLPIILLLLILLLVGILPLPLLITCWTVIGVMGFSHDYIHDAFHLRNHWMSRIPVLRDIFAKWTQLHYLHHVDMSKNFGIFIFHWDHVFRSFWKTSDVKIPKND